MAVGEVIVRGPFGPYNFNTPSLNSGITFYTATTDDILLDVWVEVLTGFNGTTPKCDIGFFQGAFVLGNYLRPLSVDVADVVTVPGFKWGNRTAFKNTGLRSSSMMQNRDVPARFTAALTMQVWVSQTGASGGTAVGGTQGSLQVYVKTATPDSGAVAGGGGGPVWTPDHTQKSALLFHLL